MGSNAHVAGGREGRDDAKDAADSEIRGMNSASGRADDKNHAAGNVRAWFVPAASALGGVATLLVEGSIGLLTALASGAMALLRRPAGSVDPAMSQSQTRRTMVHAVTPRRASAEKTAADPGPGRNRLETETNGIEPFAQLTPTPLATGPNGSRQPSNGNRGRG